MTITTDHIADRALPHHPLSLARIKGTVKLGFKSLWNHRLRSLLTALGIVFGVCSVIAMLAIGEGASYEAREQIRRLGSTNIIIRSVKPPEDTRNTANQNFMVEYGITYGDVRAVRATVPGVVIEVPARIIRKDAWNGGRRVGCEIYGTMPSYPVTNKHQVAEGRFFTELELDGKRNVCVLERNVAEELFPIGGAIGKTIHVGEQYYQVIGIMQDKDQNLNGASGPSFERGRSSDRAAIQRIYVPLSAVRERFGETLLERTSGSMNVERVELHEVTVQVMDEEAVIETGEVIAGLLESRHKKKDYELVVPMELLNQAKRTKRIFNIVLGAIAALSLLVGGIGIMNIMLANVTERTREIGIRRALGAKEGDIVIQFLVETVILSATGGAIGVLLGIIIPFFIEFFADMKTIVALWSPVLAFSISAMVGVVFGLYPALRAAKMDPVEALRHE